MSQAGRKAHDIHKAQHAQREIGQEKPKLAPVGSDTTWIPEFLSAAKGIDWFNADSIICIGLGHTHQDRENALRKASAMGVLRMTAHRENGVFVEYRWHLA